MNNSRARARLACLLATSLLLGACATTPPESSIAALEKQLGEQYPGIEFSAKKMGDASSTVALTAPLGLPQTIQILLSHSPQVRMELAKLGVADAEALQAELIDNPHLSIGALKPEDGGRWQLDTSLSQPLLALFTRPLRRQLAQENVLEAQLQLQAELQQLIATTSEYYFAAVAALQHCYVHNKMLEATRARQQLALSLYRAGNISENNFLSYDNELRRVQQQLEKRQTLAYEKQLVLLNHIGLASTQSIELATQLPLLPVEQFDHQQLLKLAKANRADIKITQQQLAILAQRQQLIRKEQGWRDMNVGLNAEREFDGANNYGPEVEFALPIFNRGQGKLAAINAQKNRLNARLQQLELNTDTTIAQALNRMDSARTQLNSLEAALTVAEKRVELSNREVNFMLGSPLELLSIKRQQIQLAHEFTETLKAYWQARAQLELAVGRSLAQPENTGDHSIMHHSTEDHAEMNHSDMDHSTMDHSEMNHSTMDHAESTAEKTNSHQDHNHHQEHQHD